MDEAYILQRCRLLTGDFWCTPAAMASLPPISPKTLAFGDVTRKGTNTIGIAAAVILGGAFGAAAGVLVADRIANPTDDARAYVGACAGACAGAFVSGGAAGRDPSITLAGFALGAVGAVIGTRFLAPLAVARRKKKKAQSKESIVAQCESVTNGSATSAEPAAL